MGAIMQGEGRLGVLKLSRCSDENCVENCHFNEHVDKITRSFELIWKAGVKHGDIAARNIRLNGEPIQVCIFDFGHSTVCSSPVPQSSLGAELSAVKALIADDI
jgi:tRNA A-37 threonylcarbamoyl transferase component Bud32